MNKRYALHPQAILSINDNQFHYISYPQLIKLYNLNPKDCIKWDDNDPKTFQGRNYQDYTHLSPLYSGNYAEDISTMRQVTSKNMEFSCR